MSKARKSGIGFGLLLAVVAMLTVFVGTSAAKTITIGELNSLTGVSAAPAETLQKGFLLEAAALKVKGSPLKVTVLDDKSDMSAAISGVTQLIKQDKVSAVIGPFPQMVATASRSIAEKNKTPEMLYAPPTLANLKNKTYKWSFLCTAGPDGCADALLKAAKLMGYKKIVAIGDTIPVHQETLKIFKKWGSKFGIKFTILSDTWDLSATDVSSVVTKIAAAARSANPDALFILSNPIHVPAIQKGLKAQGITTPVVGSAAGTSPAIFLQGPSAVEGFMAIGTGITGPSQLPANYPGKKAMVSFATRYQAKYNSAPDFYAGFGYDAIHLLAYAMQKAGGDNKAKVQKALENIKNWKGTQGVFSYSKTDHVGIHGGFDLWKVVNGQFKLVKVLNPNGLTLLTAKQVAAVK
jgi:branched-chain amino acid transport system substrate-binding protein